MSRIVPGLAVFLAVCSASVGLGWAAPRNALNPTEVDHDAYWIESAVCSMSIRTSAGAEPGAMLGTLITAPAQCTGNVMAQHVAGGVQTMLQRGFRVRTAHHQITLLPARADGEAGMLVTGLFTLERPAVKSPPIPR